MDGVRVIGLSGTNGAGKDFVAELLAERCGFLFADATEMLAAELRARGLPLDRAHKSALSAEWRREFGMGVVVDKAVKLFQESSGTYKGLVVSSLRHPGEADRVHVLGGTVLWIDADPKIRYERIQTANRGRDAEDKKTYEDFLAEEQREMTPVGDAATLNMGAVKERADSVIYNNTNSDDLWEHLKAALGIE
jgi:dephospho-CoA kinase